MLKMTFNNIYNNMNRVLSRHNPVHKKFWPMYISKAGYPSKTPQGHDESDKDFDERMYCYFSRCDIDGWELRKGLNDLAGMDLIPNPKIVTAALYACRRLDDYACTTRLLEMVKMKCGPHEKTIWPYILEEISPALDELGICTPDEMGYDKPELALCDVYEVED